MNKNIVLLLLTTLVISCTNESEKPVHEPFEWLMGTWERTDVGVGEEGYEVWEIGEEGLAGIGTTIMAGDTIFKEMLYIVYRDGKYYYVADVPQNPESVYFEISDLNEDGFRSSNPDHDFPKQINYSLGADSLLVTISGDGQSMGFKFVKRNK